MINMFKIKSVSKLAMPMMVTTVMMMSMIMMMVLMMVLMMITIAGDLRRARRTLVATTGQAKAAATKSCLLTVNDDHDGFRNFTCINELSTFSKSPLLLKCQDIR